MSQIITMQVDGSYLKYTGGSDGGATESYKATTLRMTFSAEWEGTSKTVYFTDALGEKSVSVVLGTDRHEALTAAGYATVTVKGVAVSGGATERVITTAARKFRVQDSEIPGTTDNAGVTPSEKDQLQSEIEAIKGTIQNAAQSAAAAAKSADDAAQSAAAAQDNYEEAKENESKRNQAERLREDAETGRVLAENGRTEAEKERQNAENERKAAETERETAEMNRTTAESARNVFESYNSGKEYIPGNKVSFKGSSYLCIAPCTGIAPPSANFWLEIAAKGADGGTVETSGAYGFLVDAEDNLILHYTGDQAPDFVLSDDGHLLLNLGNGIDLGRVKGGTGEKGEKGDPGITEEEQAELLRAAADAKANAQAAQEAQEQANTSATTAMQLSISAQNSAAAAAKSATTAAEAAESAEDAKTAAGKSAEDAKAVLEEIRLNKRIVYIFGENGEEYAGKIKVINGKPIFDYDLIEEAENG